jgi:hypothetical protein
MSQHNFKIDNLKIKNSRFQMVNFKSILPKTNLSKREIRLLTILFPIPGWTIFVAVFALYKVIQQKRKPQTIRTDTAD